MSELIPLPPLEPVDVYPPVADGEDLAFPVEILGRMYAAFPPADLYPPRAIKCEWCGNVLRPGILPPIMGVCPVCDVEALVECD